MTYIMYINNLRSSYSIIKQIFSVWLLAQSRCMKTCYYYKGTVCHQASSRRWCGNLPALRCSLDAWHIHAWLVLWMELGLAAPAVGPPFPSRHQTASTDRW